MKYLILKFALIVSCFQPVLASGNWIHGGRGFFGADPVVSGTVQNNKRVFVCSGRTSNGYQAGHLVDGQSKCYVAWGSSYIGFDSYRVLQNPNSFKWVDRNSAPENKLVKLDPEDGYRTLICRYNGLPGKVVHGNISNGLCYTSWGSGNTSHTSFQVLIYK